MSLKKMMIEENRQEEKGLRLNKYLSDAGVCSRREADKLIAEGRVKINGKIAIMGQRVNKGDQVEYNGKKLVLQEKLIMIALNKPEGIECTNDRSNPDNVMDFINYQQKVFYIGRLDKNSCGLLLLTNDGDLANRIAKSVNNHEKEYIVKVNKVITDEFIKKMSNGVEILDTVTKKCKVRKIDEYTFGIILTQGLNRQIRRMCKALSYKVVKLKRIRIMNIMLGDLKEGTYRKVTDEELREMMKAVIS
ncbi:MAG: pseudouridine synthase [Lachnospiraceae bacterium]|nr:pseudouridine synthase [Lachnospiraceae bacterium]